MTDGSGPHTVLWLASPFVGRASELAALGRALDEVLAGRGRVVAISGEPGIGKTRLVQELEASARQRGIPVHWGRTPESEGAAYWPWLRAIRSVTASVDIEPLRPVIERYAADLVRLFPEVRQIVPDVPEPQPGGDAGDQLHLFDSVATVLREAASQQPLVVALEDLHWADRASLSLLQYIAGECGDVPLLLLLTYRDAEVEPGHPFGDTLAELARLPNHEAIALPALSPPDVEDYIRSVTGRTPSRDLVDRLVVRSEGNPFFLSQLVAIDGGRGTSTVPAGVRAAVARRLQRLLPACNNLLTIGAVAGQSFRFDLLAALYPEPEDTLIDLLDEALAARILDDGQRPGVYRFHHALVQEAVLEGLSAARRARLHGRIGEALERIYGDRPERAAELAHHFREASDLHRDYAAKALIHAKRAAVHAESQYAWEEAARLYGICIELLESIDDAGDDEVDLLLAQGRCLLSTANPYAASQVAFRAAKRLRDTGDGSRVANVLEMLYGYALPPDAGMELLEVALAAVGDTDPHRRAQLLVGAAGKLHADRQLAGQWLDEASALAAAHGFRDTEATVLQLSAKTRDPDENIRRLRRALALYDSLGDHAASAECYFWIGSEVMMRGHARDFIPLADEIEAHAERVRDDGALDVAFNLREGLAAAKGDVHHVIDASKYGRLHGFVPMTDLHAALRGDLDEALDIIQHGEWLAGTDVYRYSGWAWLEVARGDLESARRRWQQYLRALEPRGHAHRTASLIMSMNPWLLQLMDTETCERVRRVRPIRFLIAHSVDYARGLAALKLERIDEAEESFRAGQAWAAEQKLTLLEGQNLHGLAEVAKARGDLAGALGYLDRAINLFERCGVGLYLGHAKTMRYRLRATGGPARASYPAGLSQREVEVLRLLAMGRSNAAIADELVISPATVARHVSNILARTGLSNRTEAAAFAVAHGLTGQTDSTGA